MEGEVVVKCERSQTHSAISLFALLTARVDTHQRALPSAQCVSKRCAYNPSINSPEQAAELNSHGVALGDITVSHDAVSS
jgi:hypothetical protein